MWDFTANIGRKDFDSNVAGKHTIHEKTNSYGKKLCNIATSMDMNTVSTKFKNEREHKITWLLPGKTIGNQIDHVLISRKWVRIINDVRSCRGNSTNTYHILHMAKIKMKLIKKSNSMRKVKGKWNISKLNNEDIF